MSAPRASGVIWPIRSARAPTKAAPEAVSATVKRAPACWEPTWFFSSSRSGRSGTASPSAMLVRVTPRWPAKGIAIVMPLAIASKSVIEVPLSGRGSAALEFGVAGATVLEGGLDRVLGVLGGEEGGGFGPGRLVGGGQPAFAEAAEDLLGHRVRLGRAGGELLGEGARAPLELLPPADRGDHPPPLP